MPRVRILRQTRHEGAPAWPKANLEVPEEIAARWVERGIAEAIDGEPNRRRSRKAPNEEE